MDRTVLKKLLAVALIVCGMGLASQAAALTIGDSNYLGSYTPPEPASPADEVNYINTLIAQASPSGPTDVGGVFYTRSSNDCGGPCPTAVEAGAVKEDPTDGSIDVTGFTYLIGKYDGPNGAGAVWYVGDLTGVQTIPLNAFDCGKGPGCGLSHMSLYNPGTTTVPEPGTLLLVGTGLVAVGLWRRRR